jgi:alkanesulfonate monooxygenase SsuD/methylene tetrahydromethanopterin reductase-like flavin-dependent oxidoreductase (luciferase family)
MLEEAAACVRRLLHEPPVTFDGTYFHLDDAQCEPRPLQAKLPIWIGGGGEKRTLRIVARHADGWNVPFISPEEFRRKNEVLDRHCEAAGRDPSEITRSVNVGLAWREEDLEPQFGRISNFVRPGVLMGSEDEVVDRVGQYVAAGAQQVNIAMRAPWDVEGLERLAEALELA